MARRGPSCRWTPCLVLVAAAVCLLQTAAAAAAAALDEAGSPQHAAANSTSAQGSSHAAQAQHKPLMPLVGTDIGLFLVVAVALFIASGAGVGGGVLVVPSLLVISQFTTIAAVALSNITILSSSVANLIFNLPRKSVLRPGPLIDWDLVLLFGPPTVAGSIAGSYINMVIPSWVTKTCLFLLLLPMAWRMVDKAHSLFRHETAAKKATAQSFEPEDLPTAAAATVAQLQPGAHLPAAATGAGPAVPDAAEDAPAADAGSTSSCSAVDASAAVQQTGGQGEPSAAPPADIESGCAGKAALQLPQQQPCSLSGGPGLSKGQQVQMGCWQLPSKDPEWSCRTDPATCETVRHKLEREQAQMLPPFQCGLLVLLLADVAVASLLAGYLLSCGTWQYWLLVLSPLLVMLLVWGVARHHILWKAAWKARLGLGDAGDLKWDTHTTTIYPAICISAGVIAGMLGLGGGLVLAPLMLELGVSPPVSAASTQVTLLISSSTSAIVYAVNGAVPWDYGVVLVIIGFVATLLGQWLVSWLVRRLGRPSILVITLAVMFSAATFAAAAVVVITFVGLAGAPEKWTARKGVCPA